MIGEEIAGDRSYAVAAAQQATEAAASLLLFSKEGPAGTFALPEDTIEKLADAAKIAIEIELNGGARDDGLGELLAAVVRFTEGWVG